MKNTYKIMQEHFTWFRDSNFSINFLIFINEFFDVNGWELVYNKYGLTKRYFDFDKLKINEK